MKKVISLYDDNKNIRLTYLGETDENKPFELTDGNMQHTYFTESQLQDLYKMIEEILQTLNKRDY